MSQLRVILQESVNGGETTESTRTRKTILAFLSEKMDGVDGIRNIRRRRTFKERLGLNNMGSCCGATWGFRPNTINLSDNEDEEAHHQPHQQEEITEPGQTQTPVDNLPDPICMTPSPSPSPVVVSNSNTNSSSSMNLAAALAAERHLRSDGRVVGPSDDDDDDDVVGTTPLRVSLMRLLAETTEGEEKGGGVGNNDTVCCVCMGRKKGAAFIPCGHTFCRVCSREMWLNRGSCPLCNRSILEILDIF